MRPRTVHALLVILILILTACDSESGTPTTTTEPPVWVGTLGEPSDGSPNEISEAFHSLGVERALRREFPGRYGGQWRDGEDPAWGIVVAFTAGGAAPVRFLEDLVAGTPAEGHVRVVTVEVSLRVLRRDRSRVSDAAQAACLPGLTATGLDLKQNRSVVGVEDPEVFLAAAAAAGISIPDTVAVEEQHIVMEIGMIVPDPCDTVMCPCVGCPPRAVITVEAREIEGGLWYGDWLDCDPEVTSPTAAMADGRGPTDIIEVPPGTEMTLTVTPVNPRMVVEVSMDPSPVWPQTGMANRLNIERTGDFAWTIWAPDWPGQWSLSVRVDAPRADSSFGFLLTVVEDNP